MKNLRNNKHFITFVCLIVGASLLCGAAVANIGNAGGYEAYKDGLFGLLTLEDYDASGTLTVSANGEALASVTYAEKLNTKAGVGEVYSHSRTSLESTLYGEVERDLQENFSVVNAIDHPSGRDYTRWNRVSTVPGYPEEWHADSRNNADGVLTEFRVDAEDEYTTKLLDVIEMAIDLVVGDLKNNFVYLGEEDGLTRYRVSLSGDQLPEIVRAMISLISDESLYLGTNDYGVRAAPGFEPYMLEDEALEEYYELRELLWEKVYNDPTSKYYQAGYFIIEEDLSYNFYTDLTERYKEMDELPVSMLFDDFEMVIMMLDGEPEITLATCELAIDENGALAENTLSGTVEMRLVNGQKLAVTLELDASISPIEGGIERPSIPADATIYDYSIGNKENGYAYTITKNGVTTHHSETEEQQAQSLARFEQMQGFERIQEAASWAAAGWFDYQISPESFISQGIAYYEVAIDYDDTDESVDDELLKLVEERISIFDWSQLETPEREALIAGSLDPNELVALAIKYNLISNAELSKYTYGAYDGDVSYEVDGEAAETVQVPVDIDANGEVSYEIADVDGSFTIDGEPVAVIPAGEDFDYLYSAADAIGIIGGADGPTTVVVSEPIVVDTSDLLQNATAPWTTVETSVPIVVEATTDVAAVPYESYYETGVVYINAEQFEAVCSSLFAASDSMNDYAEQMGLEPIKVVAILLDDYQTVTGHAFGGYVFWNN